MADDASADPVPVPPPKKRRPQSLAYQERRQRLIAERKLADRERRQRLRAERLLAEPQRKANREGIYDPDRHPRRAQRMALMGQNEAEMAVNLGISGITLRQWKAKHPEFKAALESGMAEADENVAHALYRRAVGGIRVPAVKIFLPKDATEPVYAPYEEVLPPDVVAAKHWLAVRDPRRWREKKEVEVSGGLLHEITVMTPEQRMARLLELQAKAALVIEGEAVEVATEDDQGEPD